MGRLVAPIYNLSPKQERVLEFKGWNMKSVIDDGEMRDMYNLSSDEYPCLYQRKPRGLYQTGIADLPNPTALLVKNDKLAIISDGKFYYGGKYQPGLVLSDETKMVAINTKICFFPEKKYFVVIPDEDGTHQIGNIAEETVVSDVTVTLTTSTITFPESAGFDTMFKAGDVVQMSAEPDILNISAEVKAVTDTSITFPDETFIELIAEGQETRDVAAEKITLYRPCPDLDFVIESNNRLWGVSNADNTIYASKLGDPTNWFYYQLTNWDSFAAEQGTDGEWTGCAAYSNHLLFFKEDCIHKVYGSKPSNYQIETAQCHALEKGSSKSVAIINDTVLYKSRLGIMAYAGGTPFLISENFGTEEFKDAVAGTDGIKYYVSVMQNNEPVLLVYDMNKYLWHKEDDTRVNDFCYFKGKLLYIDSSDRIIYEMDSDVPLESEADIEWMAQLGPFDEWIEERKVYSHLNMRLKLDEYASLMVYISIDEGPWERIMHINDEKESSQFIPIVPRRCNKFKVKLEGTGRCMIESLVRVYRDSTGRRDVR